MTQKRKAKTSKPRHVWQINPKSRVKKSGKKYKRDQTKKKEKNWWDDLFD